MERHAGARGISLDELKLKRAMCRKDAAGLSCDTQRRRLPEKELYNVNYYRSTEIFQLLSERFVYTMNQEFIP